MNDLNELRRAAKATTNRAFRGSAVTLNDAWLAWKRVIVALTELAPDNSAQKERLNRLLTRVDKQEGDELKETLEHWLNGGL